MNNLSRIITELSYEELKDIRKDLNEGNIERLINKRISHFEEGGATICPVCHTSIEHPENSTFTLIFGQKDFRRKATFCATDCLKYFIEKIEESQIRKIDGER